MAAPTIHASGHEQVVSPSAATKFRTYTATRDGDTKGILVLYTASATSHVPEAVVYGGVNVPLVPDFDAVIGGGSRRVMAFWLGDLSAASGSTLEVTVEEGPFVYNIYWALINHSAAVDVLDSDSGEVSSIALATGGIEGRAFAAANGTSEMTEGGGQSVLWDTGFVGGHNSEGSEKALTGIGSMSYSGGVGGMGALALGGVDALVAISTRVEVEVDIRAGFQMTTTQDILIQPLRLWIEVGIRSGFRMTAAGAYEVMLVPIDKPHETTSTTEGKRGDGSTAQEGDSLTWHPSDKPTWEAPGAASHPDLATHDSLGLATQSELDAHTGDTSDAHDASAISVADVGGNFTATDVEGVLAELAAGSGGYPPGLLVYLFDTFK